MSKNKVDEILRNPPFLGMLPPPWPPPLPHVTPRGLLVLRRVRAGDPYRDKGRGRPGRAARFRSLLSLQEKGLVRLTQDGFWRVTANGTRLLARYPERGKP
jgi:hypothetical protein